VTSDAPILAILVGGGLLALALLLFALLLLSRRQLRRDLREIVVSLEDLRTGDTQRRAEVSAGSPLVLVADAVNRLAGTLQDRSAEAASSREKLRALLDTAGDHAVVAAGAQGEIRAFSPGAAALFGRTEDEVLAQPVSLLFEETAWRELLPKLARRNFRDRGLELRVRLQRRDGGVFPGALQVRLSPSDPGGLVYAFRDVTEQNRLEQELRDSEARYRTLVEGLAQGVFIARDGALVYANRALHSLAALPAEALAGRPLRDFVATRDVLLVQETLSDVQARGASSAVRATWLDAGRQPVAQVRIDLSAVHHGGQPAVLGLVADETTERLIEAELRQNEARLDAVLEATSDGLLVLADTSAGGVIRMTNQAFAEQFDLRVERLLGASEADLFRLLRERGEGAEDVAAFLSAAGEGRRVEAVAIDGRRPRVLELKCTPLRDRAGDAVGRVLATRDLTDQKAFERRLEQNAEELRRSKDALETSYKRLHAVNQDLEGRTRQLDSLASEMQRLNTMKSNLLANVSHELQTPLVSIRGYTEMILKGRLGAITEEQRKGLTLSMRNIDRLIGMIDNLLAFSRMDQGTAELHLTVFPLRAVVEESLDTLRGRMEARGIRATVRLPDPEVALKADRDKVVQVFLNVIGNAVKYNRDGGAIEIAAVGSPPGFVSVRVRDTGVGIAREDLERVFDRFYRAEGAEGREGTGLGLSIVRGLLELHGCSIRAESEPGRGSAFTFTLPLADPAGDAPEGDRDGGSTEGDGPPAPDGSPRFRVLRPGDTS
jgi:PAS domain S-box-containing protein